MRDPGNQINRAVRRAITRASPVREEREGFGFGKNESGKTKLAVAFSIAIVLLVLAQRI